jgi:hypothetical protein
MSAFNGAVLIGYVFFMGECISLLCIGVNKAWLGAFMEVWFSYARDYFSLLSMVIDIDLFIEVFALGEA